MPSKYLPKMKVSTAKSVAKNLIATPAGKRVSGTAFKKFIKQDKDLKKLSYSSDKSTVSKLQAKKIFNKVVRSAEENQQYKVSRFAEKLGIKKGAGGAQASDIALNRVYQKGTEEELSAIKQPTEPSQEEVRRQKRHDEALKTFHKRERADETRKEQLPPQSQKAQKKRSFSPVARTALSGLHTSANQPAKTLTDQTSSPSMPAVDTDANLISVLVLPLHNPSGSLENLDWLAKKINQLVTRTLNGLGMFKIVTIPPSNQSVPIDITDEGALRLAAKRASASVCVLGTLKKTGNILNITVTMLNTQNNQQLPLVNITDEAGDIFNLERKISWQITNALQEKPGGGEGGKKTAEPPPPETAKELPI